MPAATSSSDHGPNRAAQSAATRSATASSVSAAGGVTRPATSGLWGLVARSRSRSAQSLAIPIAACEAKIAPASVAPVRQPGGPPLARAAKRSVASAFIRLGKGWSRRSPPPIRRQADGPATGAPSSVPARETAIRDRSTGLSAFRVAASLRYYRLPAGRVLRYWRGRAGGVGPGDGERVGEAMSATRYIFELEMPPVYLGETLAVVRRDPSVQIAYEETLTWDAGAAVGLLRVETGTLAIVDDLFRWWRLKQRAIGFPFNMTIRVSNRFRARFSAHTPDEVRELVARHQDEMYDRLTEGESAPPPAALPAPER